MKQRWAAMTGVLLCLAALPAAAQTAKTPVRIALNPAVYTYLPLFLAADKGYFDEQGLDVSIVKYAGSSVSQMPSVARGDLDIAPMVVGPAMFNQKNDGFDLKVIASMVESKAGWNDGTWIVIRQDLWDSGAIRTLADLKGRMLDGGPDGSPINFVVNMGLEKAGLTRADVKYSAKLATPPDWIAALRNKAVDAIGTLEPFATVIESEGLGHKLASDQDIVPWFQESYFVASAQYIDKHRDTAVAFFKAYLKAAKEIDEGGPKWRPESLAEVAKWTKLAEAEIAKMPGPPYYGQLGTIRADSIARQQDYWLSIHLVKEKVAVDSIIDSSIIDAARSQSGIR
jgi:NitT/TauT family transport system substrate-binding protein